MDFGVSRPKLASVFLTVMLISLFLTFHILYDSAVYNIQAAQFNTQERLAILNNHLPEIRQTELHPNKHPIISGNRIRFPNTKRRLPQALIIGVKKCGTRALLDMLYLHPRIQEAGEEVHFFDRDENYMKGLEWYRKKMPFSFSDQITIEKSPSYFVSSEVPERVRAMNASIRLLLIVREPVTRAISDYTQLKSYITTPSPTSSLLRKYSNHKTGTSLNELHLTSASQLNERSKDNIVNTDKNSLYQTFSSSMNSSIYKTFEELTIFPNGTINESYRPLQISMYHLHLHRWLEIFSREQILIVNGDQLIEDPVSQLTRIENFLDIEHKISSKNFYFNETKGFFCLRYQNGDRCLSETKGRKHPRVNPLVISKLRTFFSEHNQKFYDLIGENLGWPEE